MKGVVINSCGLIDHTIKKRDGLSFDKVICVLREIRSKKNYKIRITKHDVSVVEILFPGCSRTMSKQKLYY